MLNCDVELKVLAKIRKNIYCKLTVNIICLFTAAAVISIMAVGTVEVRAQPNSNHNSSAPEILSLDPQRFGTSFDCSRSGRGIPTLVCSDPDLRRADLAQMQRYYTLRHAAQSRQQDLSVIYRSRIQSLVTACSAETVISTRTEKPCVRRGLEEMRAAWLSEIQSLGNTAALDESRLGLEMMISIQQSLANIGFIPMTSVIDGIFGNATRDAIIRFQTDRGIPANGFATPPTHQALTGASLPPAAQGSSGNAVPHRQPSLDVRGDTGQPPPTAPELWTYQNRGGQDIFLLPPGAAPRPTPQSSPAIQMPPAQPAVAALALGTTSAPGLDPGCANPPPVYPPNSRRAGEEGVVQIVVTIGANGRAIGAQIAASSRSAALDEAARRAVLGWCYRPALRNGEAVQGQVTTNIRFTLQ